MTPDILIVLIVLAVTIVLFISELLRVDVIAILVMLALAWLGLVTPLEAFSGFASNAVISIIAIMILAYGVQRSGLMNRVTQPIRQIAGSSETRLTALITSAVGGVSAFMLNIGAAVLFMPVVLRVSKRTRVPAARLLMPMGFAAILGGTLTMVGSSPLIILNDLLQHGGQPAFGLFRVTPLGLALLAAGILYFVLIGKRVLPKGKADKYDLEQQELLETWQLPSSVYLCVIPRGSILVGMTVEESALWTEYGVHLMAMVFGEEPLSAPWRHTHFGDGQIVALMGNRHDVQHFVDDYGLRYYKGTKRFEDLLGLEKCGFAELIIPPLAPVAGKSIREISMRKMYHVEPLMLLSGDREERGDFSDRKLGAGDAVIVYGRWDRIRAMGDRKNFILITPVDAEEDGKSNPVYAMACFLGAIGLTLLGVQLSLGLLSGALAMVLLRVMTIEEAYKAIDWRTVFLLAGLIPLGIAVKNTGTAGFIAAGMMDVLQGGHVIFLLLAIGVLATLFSLFMSNVAATVILVPLAMAMGGQAGVNPSALALLVAVCASNTFLIPTHQVNALLMGPGGYRTSDYMKAGGIMTLIFLTIAVGFIYLVYL